MPKCAFCICARDPAFSFSCLSCNHKRQPHRKSLFIIREYHVCNVLFYCASQAQQNRALRLPFDAVECVKRHAGNRSSLLKASWNRLLNADGSIMESLPQASTKFLCTRQKYKATRICSPTMLNIHGSHENERNERNELTRPLSR